MNGEKPMTRPDLYVVARFLEKLAAKGGSSKKTQLQMAVGLNFNVYSKYLRWLSEKNMIVLREESDGQSVALTEKGLRIYENLLRMLDDMLNR